jgi:hypothetical protein
MDETSELSAWREVHNVLLTSVRKAQEAIAIQKAQRRYWLEEIAYNLDDNGLPAIHSVWKRPVRARTNNKVEKKRNTKVDTKVTQNKRKVTKATVEKTNNDDDDDDNDNISNEVPVPTKKRRKKNQDKVVDAVRPKKHTKIVIKRATPIKKHSSQQSINTSTRENMDDDDNSDSDIGLTSHDIFESTTTTSPNQHESTTLSFCNEPISSFERISSQDEYMTAAHGETVAPTSSISSTRDFRNDPNWTDHTNVHHHASPISMTRNSSSISEDEQRQVGIQLPFMESPHAMTGGPTTLTSSLTPIIRNYTSLQDIAMNDDSDDEDRF